MGCCDGCLLDTVSGHDLAVLWSGFGDLSSSVRTGFGAGKTKLVKVRFETSIMFPRCLLGRSHSTLTALRVSAFVIAQTRPRPLPLVSSTFISTSEAYFRTQSVSLRRIRFFGDGVHGTLTRTDGQYTETTTDWSVCVHEKRGVIMMFRTRRYQEVDGNVMRLR